MVSQKTKMDASLLSQTTHCFLLAVSPCPPCWLCTLPPAEWARKSTSIILLQLSFPSSPYQKRVPVSPALSPPNRLMLMLEIFLLFLSTITVLTKMHTMEILINSQLYNILQALKAKLNSACVSFSHDDTLTFYT